MASARDGSTVRTQRVLDLEPVPDLEAYVASGGGDGLKWALGKGPAAVVAAVEASGLRGRGGAGFPTGTKWKAVMAAGAGPLAATVVVNAAEGEPGTFKDRAIIRANPYRVLEGALVAALCVGADTVVVATKQRFGREVEVLRRAVAEVHAAGWTKVAAIDIVEGPDEYLYGEETAQLEVLEGRRPFPRIAPPWRRGLDDAVDDSSASGVDLVDPGGPEGLPPVLVDNVETIAHVALIAGRGVDWFRSVGDPSCPGTIVCTLSGPVGALGVVEVATGTPLDQVVAALSDPAVRRDVAFALAGVSNALLPGAALGTPLTYEHMKAAGSGLGTAGFILFDDSVDPLSVALGASRFLAVESCGQCTPCKQDGLAIARSLEELRVPVASGADPVSDLRDHLETVTDGARCYLATQHQDLVSSFLAAFPGSFRPDGAQRIEPYPIVEMLDLVQGPDGATVVLDEGHQAKQPDWTFDPVDSGQAPADRAEIAEG